MLIYYNKFGWGKKEKKLGHFENKLGIYVSDIIDKNEEIGQIKSNKLEN